MIDAFIRAFGQAVESARHEMLGGWFGRNFEPNPMNRQPDDRATQEPDFDPLGRTRDLGIDR